MLAPTFRIAVGKSDTVTEAEAMNAAWAHKSLFRFCSEPFVHGDAVTVQQSDPADHFWLSSSLSRDAVELLLQRNPKAAVRITCLRQGVLLPNSQRFWS